MNWPRALSSVRPFETTAVRVQKLGNHFDFAQHAKSEASTVSQDVVLLGMVLRKLLSTLNQEEGRCEQNNLICGSQNYTAMLVQVQVPFMEFTVHAICAGVCPLLQDLFTFARSHRWVLLCSSEVDASFKLQPTSTPPPSQRRVFPLP